MPRPLLIALTLTALSLPGLNAQAEDVYRWVDENGVTHFGSSPPKGQQSERVDAKSGHSEPVDYSEQFGSAEDETSEQDAEAESEPANKTSEEDVREACRQARENLETIQNGGRIAETAEDGSRRYLSSEELAQREERARRFVEEACN